MFRRENRNTSQGRRRLKLWPILSALLVICYLAVSAWFAFFGNGTGRDADGDTGDQAAAVTATPAPTLAQTPTPAPTPEIQENAGNEANAATMRVTTPAVKVRGLYVSAWSAGMENRMAKYVEICETTEINALVIDVKDDLGQITFITDTEGLSATSVRIIPDIEGIVSDLKSRGVYTIARVVCFKDPVWSKRQPELAIQNAWGELWTDGIGGTWLDPYKTGAWDYIAAVSLEAARVGFDEVQLDYVRFPSDGRLGDISFGATGEGKSKTEIINEFVAHIRAILAKEGVRLSADVFGIIAISNADSEDIGQNLMLLQDSTDSLCPMIYPSHFANKKQNGTGQRINGVLFEAPDLEPYEVVYNILVEFSRRLKNDGGQAVMRPYLQAFTAAYLGEGYYQQYRAEQIQEQIQAVYDAGFDEWILWNHNSIYSDDFFVVDVVDAVDE